MHLLVHRWQQAVEGVLLLPLWLHLAARTEACAGCTVEAFCYCLLPCGAVAAVYHLLMISCVACVWYADPDTPVADTLHSRPWNNSGKGVQWFLTT